VWALWGYTEAEDCGLKERVGTVDYQKERELWIDREGRNCGLTKRVGAVD